MRAFNGDPPPGNYLFQRGGRVTFLDFGLVKHFTCAELQPLMQIARTVYVERNPEAFHRGLENAKVYSALPRRSAPRRSSITWPSSTTPSANRDRATITSDYASSVVRRFFDLRSPITGYIAVR